MPRYHLITSAMRSGGYSEFTAADDADAITQATATADLVGADIVSLSEITILASGSRTRRVDLEAALPPPDPDHLLVLEDGLGFMFNLGDRDPEGFYSFTGIEAGEPEPARQTELRQALTCGAETGRKLGWIGGATL